MKIAYRQWTKNQIFYVSQLPGEYGVDWGYTTDPKKAKLLNKYWQRRFIADCRCAGSEAKFISIPEKGE